MDRHSPWWLSTSTSTSISTSISTSTSTSTDNRPMPSWVTLIPPPTLFLAVMARYRTIRRPWSPPRACLVRCLLRLLPATPFPASTLKSSICSNKSFTNCNDSFRNSAPPSSPTTTLCLQRPKVSNSHPGAGSSTLGPSTWPSELLMIEDTISGCKSNKIWPLHRWYRQQSHPWILISTWRTPSQYQAPTSALLHPLPYTRKTMHHPCMVTARSPTVHRWRWTWKHPRLRLLLGQAPAWRKGPGKTMP